jgi:dipeptidyl aminopeptidase/acylaminoacyl peptidase
MSDRLEATARRALTAVRAPDEAAAQDRAWATVRGAYRGRPAPTPARSRRRVALVPVAAVLVGAIAFSPAGATVKRFINRALSARAGHISHAPALSLPAPGRLLLSNARGTWVVSAHGAVKRLGAWTQASWSPRGKYLAVASAGALAAVDPHGALAWRLSERAASDPRWYTPSGYRVAYRSGGDLREVTGTGRGDHLLATSVAPIAPAWRPEHDFQLAYVTRRGAIVVRDGDTGVRVWHSGPHPGRPVTLSWSPTGTQLVLVTSAGAWLYRPGQTPPLRIRLPVRGPVLDATASPDGRWLALVRGGTSPSHQAGASTPQLQIADLTTPTRPTRTVLSGIPVSQPTWAPDSRWLLVTWSAADQWWFVRATGRARIIAESRVAAKLGPGGESGPLQLDGWCCPQ